MTSTFENEPVLELARIILDRANYITERIDAPSNLHLTERCRLLLAQNPFFVLAVGVATTVEGLQGLEQVGTYELTRRAAASELKAKQWDLYLVLLTEQAVADDGRASTQLITLNYNTRGIRRLARAGVVPTMDSVERALRPFLPLRDVTDAVVVEDALALLEKELTQEGVEANLAGRVVAAFRNSGSLSSV